jgi:hypothetical protein
MEEGRFKMEDGRWKMEDKKDIQLSVLGKG